MKTRITFLLNALFFVLALGFTACDGDKGEVGPTGPTGPTGNNGTGFDELTQYGNIAVTFSGTRFDETDFSETLNFKYMPNSGISDNSAVYEYGEGDLEFVIGRENKGQVLETGRTKESGTKNSVWFDFYRESGEITFDQFVVYADIITDDFKSFEINYNNGYWNEGFDVEVTNYSYNETTGKLKFNFSHTILGVDNNTGNDITITGTADLIVFKMIENPS